MQLALVTLGIRVDVHGNSACLPVLAGTARSLTARPEACVQGTAGSECRNMAGPSGELGEVEGGSR